MKNLLLYIFIFLFFQNLSGQNIPHANFTAPWGVQVNTYNGNLFHQRTDLVIPNQGLSIEFHFAYNSFRDTLDLGFGNGWTNNYYLRYEVISSDSMLIEHADGRRDVYVKNGDNFTSPIGIFDVWEEYDMDKYRLTNKYGMQYYFDSTTHRLLTHIEDTNGNQLNLNYNSQGELISVVDHSDRMVTLNWAGGHLLSITDDNFEEPRIIQFSYTDNLLGTVTDLEDNTMTYGYNEAGTLSFILNEKNDEMQFKYNEQQRIAELITCISTFHFIYNEDIGKTYVNEENNSGDRITTYDYDEDGKLLQKTGNCCGYNTQYQYDVDRNISGITDANGSQFMTSHDGTGNTLLTYDANGNSQSFSYDPLFNRPTDVTDKKGNTTTMQYDNTGNLKKIIQPENVELEFGYTATGNINSVQDGNGQPTSLMYNNNNDVTFIQYPIGTEIFEYDPTGNLKVSRDGNGNPVFYEYDKLNRLVSISDSLENTIIYSYDQASNPATETDANGNEKSFNYDAHHRLESVETHSGTTLYTYDASDNFTEIIDANQHITTFEYDQRDLLVAETDPLGNTTSYNYDGNGNLLSRTDANGATTTYTYDLLNRLTSKSYDGNTDAFSYDANGNLVFSSNNQISTGYTYDNLNRLVSKSIINWGITIDYTYDHAGNRTSMTDPTGMTLYEYDENNRLTGITNPANETTSFTYDIGGRLIRQDYANGTYAEYIYDVANRLSSLFYKKETGEVLAFYEYTYDANGNRTNMTIQEGSATYTYDADNRLTDVTYSGMTMPPNQIFEFDGTGNRTTLNGLTYTYDDADRLQSISNGTTYSYDNNGNLISKNENGSISQYSYNGENRLTEVELPDGEKINYEYDPFGNRISRKNQNGTVYYLLDGENILMELNENYDVLARFTSGLEFDSWISMDRNNQSYFYHFDGLGSITAMTNSSQEITNKYQYDAYGNIVSQSGNVANPFTYTGREWEEDLGLFYYRQRFYDPLAGRFISKDNFRGITSRPLSLNRYIYVEGNPINNIDPEGNFLSRIFEGAVGAGLELFTQYEESGGTFDCVNWWDVGKAALMGALLPGSTFKNVGTGLAKLNRAAVIKKTMPGIAKQRNKHNKIRKDVPALRNNYASDAELNKRISGYRSEGISDIRTGYHKYKNDVESVSGYLGAAINPPTPCDTSQGAQEEEKEEVPPPPTLPDPDPTPPILDDQTICIPIIRSVDPNEIIGPDGCGIEHWVAKNTALPYTILYENDPDFATAPAQTVLIEHTFDSEVNPYSFRLGNFGFGDYYFTVPEETSFYSTQINLSDSLGVLLDVVAGFDIDNNKAFWIFESRDPQTGLSTTLPADVGFLLVNDSLTHAGEGFVNFTVQAASNSTTGDTIHAQAFIVFDQNPAIQTNIVFNLIDGDAPVSQIDLVNTPSDTEHDLIWSATDIGSGISHYTLYAATESGVFLPVADNLVDTTYTFIGHPDSTYRFFTVATDCVGNTEPLKEETGCALTLADTILVQPTFGNSNGNISIEVQGSIGPLNYEWSPNVSMDSVATNLVAGNYFVTVTDSLGCSLFLEIMLNNVMVSTQELDISSNQLFIHKIFPVPAHSQVTLEFTTSQKVVWMEVFDVQGKVILKKTIQTDLSKLNQEVLNVSNWAAGNYIVSIRTKNKSVSANFIKQ